MSALQYICRRLYRQLAWDIIRSTLKPDKRLVGYYIPKYNPRGDIFSQVGQYFSSLQWLLVYFKHSVQQPIGKSFIPFYTLLLKFGKITRLVEERKGFNAWNSNLGGTRFEYKLKTGRFNGSLLADVDLLGCKAVWSCRKMFRKKRVLALMMKAVCSTETLVSTYKSSIEFMASRG
jgi:hypothetical protein